jgi:hypothetical protein
MSRILIATLTIITNLKILLEALDGAVELKVQIS